MRIPRQVLPLVMVVVMVVGVTSPVRAQSGHIADPTVLEQALRMKIESDAANRAIVLRVLGSPEAASLAAELGVDLRDARSALSTMNPSQLAELASSARTIDADLTGGSQTIVISTTTLLLVLIIVILLVR